VLGVGALAPAEGEPVWASVPGDIVTGPTRP